MAGEDTRENTPATTASSQTSTRKYVYKTLPIFDPIYYQRWTRQVRQAFHERVQQHRRRRERHGAG